MAASSVLSVTPRAPVLTETNGTRPAHHLDDTRSSFTNPWPSFKPHDLGMWAKMIFNHNRSVPAVPDDIEERLGKVKPTFGIDPTSNKLHEPTKIKATWLGHACFLVELPAPAGCTRGARILFDPVFSHRCSPFQFAGPGRYTKPPCTIEEIPDIDCIVISHNHYDHMDTDTLRTLEELHRPHIFAPLGNGDYFASINIPKDRTHIMDWWEGKDVVVKLSDGADHTFIVNCTPCQHFTGRGILDRFKSLWASWAITDPSTGVKVWFGGDTAYRTVLDGEDENEVPVCPEFKRIGDLMGPFDLALIPVGAYQPRNFMSSIHCAPQDSVQLFKEIKAKRAIGMHWTWILTTEPVMEPPRRLAEECEKAGIAKGLFDVCGLGETVNV